LLLTLYQSTENSGAVTRAAAKTVADAVGARHVELDVDALSRAYVALAEKALGRKLDWERDDVALQNIQARVRAPSAWLLTNVEDRLLLATSNRSEAAVGYATMDGDTAGSLSPIAGIDKAFIRRWLVWLEREGPTGIGPIPALSAVNEQAPTAELRPPAARQTDEADLMPYDVLDVIERAAIRDKRAPIEILPLLRLEFPEASDEERLRWLQRFFRLFARNQWKRERYAPSFHVDDANLDPKTWCRFPILSGGFERELAVLEAELGRQK
jgi:NAD+ synthase (glutamine-hydrolysing)